MALVLGAGKEATMLKGLKGAGGPAERGYATSEYALGTLVVCALVGAFIKILPDPRFAQFALEIAMALVDWFLRFLAALPLPR
jgi:hypothetical protein